MCLRISVGREERERQGERKGMEGSRKVIFGFQSGLARVNIKILEIYMYMYGWVDGEFSTLE